MNKNSEVQLSYELTPRSIRCIGLPLLNDLEKLRAVKSFFFSFVSSSCGRSTEREVLGRQLCMIACGSAVAPTELENALTQTRPMISI